jgi:hypothetical protein
VNLPPPLPMYSDPNERLLESVLPVRPPRLRERASRRWEQIMFGIGHCARAALRTLGVRDVDASEARSLVFIALGVAGLTMGLYFGIPTIHPPAARAASMAARAALPEQRLALRATTNAAPPPPALADSTAQMEAVMPCTTRSASRAGLVEDDGLSSGEGSPRASRAAGSLEPSARRAKRARLAKARAVGKGRPSAKGRAAAQRRLMQGSGSRAVEKSKRPPSRARGGRKPVNRAKSRLPDQLAQR